MPEGALTFWNQRLFIRFKRAPGRNWLLFTLSVRFIPLHFVEARAPYAPYLEQIESELRVEVPALIPS
jgi:hypothetical protein